MNLEPFSILDRVLEKGYILVDPLDILDTPKEIHTGHIVIRKENDTPYYNLSCNIILEQEVYSLINSDLTNKMRRVYQILGTRESSVVEKMLSRIGVSNPSGPINNSEAWNVLLDKGKYMETTAQISPSLDFLIHYKMLDYECEGYYSPHPIWIKKIKTNKRLSEKRAGELIESHDSEMINTWMISLGYIFKNNKYYLSSDEHAKSIIFCM